MGRCEGTPSFVILARSQLVAGAAGQVRRVTRREGLNGKYDFYLDEPWNVVPDSNSRVLVSHIFDQSVIYGNRIEGRNDIEGQNGVGVQFFGNAHRVVVAGNDISKVGVGINIVGFGNGDQSVEPKSAIVPNYFNVVTGNSVHDITIKKADDYRYPIGTILANGIGSKGTDTVLSDGGLMLFGNVLRGNQYARIEPGVANNFAVIDSSALYVYNSNIGQVVGKNHVVFNVAEANVTIRSGIPAVGKFYEVSTVQFGSGFETPVNYANNVFVAEGESVGGGPSPPFAPPPSGASNNAYISPMIAGEEMTTTAHFDLPDGNYTVWVRTHNTSGNNTVFVMRDATGPDVLSEFNDGGNWRNNQVGALFSAKNGAGLDLTIGAGSAFWLDRIIVTANPAYVPKELAVALGGSSITGAQGLLAVSVAPSSSLTETVTVTQGGWYSLWGRIQNPAVGSGRGFWVSVDDGGEVFWDLSNIGINQWLWKNSGLWYLTPGMSHSIKFRNAGPTPIWLDTVFLSNSQFLPAFDEDDDMSIFSP